MFEYDVLQGMAVVNQQITAMKYLTDSIKKKNIKNFFLFRINIKLDDEPYQENIVNLKLTLT